MKAVSVVKQKVTDAGGNLVERVIWEVPMNARCPEGVRYRLAFIPKGHKRPAVLYDNHHPKGHHKHIEGRESPYAFSDIPQLKADFKKDVLDWKTTTGVLS